MDGLTSAVEAIRARIRASCAHCGRDPSTIRLLAVTKTHPPATVIAAMDAGLSDFGENYAQELVAKAAAVASAGRRPRWHFIGGLQTNKVRAVMPVVASVHSVDRPSLIEELGRRAGAGTRLPVFVEVNLGGEDQKSGAAPGDAADLCRRILGVPSLRLEGLMTVPPITENPEDSRPFFRELRKLRDRLVADIAPPEGILEHLSMGMSHDFEIAIEEGATWIRVGTALFGTRIHAR